MPFAIPIIKKEEKLYAKIYQPNKNTIDTNHIFFPMFK